MDGFVTGVSIGIVVLLGSVMAAALVVLLRRSGSLVVNVALGASIFLIAAIVSFAWVYTPRAFRIGDGVFRIERTAGDVTIPLSPISEVAPLDAFLGLSLKALPGGNSGLFGIYGTFNRRDIGRYQMYGRAASGAVLLETASGKVVLTPEHRDAFLAALRKETAR